MRAIFPSDIEIAQSCRMKHIRDVAASIGLVPDDIEYYGKYKAKLLLRLINEKKVKDHHMVLVTAITPTPHGEGKTTVCIGLADGLNKIGKKTIAVLREPSLGPVFGMKGGASGGGYSQVVPMEDINLHFTGDFSAIEKANNLLAALIDNNLQSKIHNLHIDPRTIVWKRVMDMNDRSLRHIIVGLGGISHGIPREDGFNITAASEIMAILCLANDIDDLKRRLGNIYIGMNDKDEPVFARDLNAVGALAALLKEAIKPNLVQTLENNPVIMHGGPFASIAQGTNSVNATKIGLSLAEYAVTEAGFGADLGAEKFFDIKCTTGGLIPEAAVLVVTVRALRHHGGVRKDGLQYPDAGKLLKGIPNMEKHIENLIRFGMKPVVAINYFPNDSDEEIELIRETCKKYNVKAIVTRCFSEGGNGSTELAEEVIRIIQQKESSFRPLYEADLSIEEKIHCIATEIYGAKGVEYAVKAKTQMKHIKELGFDRMPVCMAKTPKSLSDDETKRGRPENFVVTVREFEFASGAGFVIPILGEMMRMPGLPSVPAAEKIDIDNSGKISGLS
jgi:formate--tetrahydrofolate ligase